jgi:hypothetical protein
MAVPFDPTDPSHLTPDQRLSELAAIFAIGVARALALRPILTAPESEQNRLDVSPKKRLHVPWLTETESNKGLEA